MDIDKATSEITGYFKDDTPESIKTTLENVKREFGSMQIALKAANEDAKNRRHQATEYREKLEQAELQISKLSDDTKLKEMQADFQNKLKIANDESEKLKESQKQLFGIFRKEFETDFQEIAKHENFEKVKNNIKIPKIENNKFLFETLTDNDIIFNREKLAEYRALGLFEGIKKPNEPPPPKVEKFDEIDIVQLAKTDPKKARAVLDQKRGIKPLFSTL